MPERPHSLRDATYRDVTAHTWEVAVLPWGATEPHNTHLPYGTDIVEADRIAADAVRMANGRGAKAIALPCVPYGVNTGQLDLPLTINMNPSTQSALLADVVGSLEAQAIAKLVVLNGHGGNDFRQMIRELQPRRNVFVCQINWYACVDPKTVFDTPGDHAGEMETSVMLHIAPELVRPLSEAGSGRERRFRPAGLRERWAWAPREWRQASTDTGIGDPRGATPEKGARFYAAVIERIAGFLVELSGTPLSNLYE